jgi:hypothetical protein
MKVPPNLLEALFIFEMEAFLLKSPQKSNTQSMPFISASGCLIYFSISGVYNSWLSILGRPISLTCLGLNRPNIISTARFIGRPINLPSHRKFARFKFWAGTRRLVAPPVLRAVLIWAGNPPPDLNLGRSPYDWAIAY